MLAEESIVAAKDLRDPFFRDDRRERQSIQSEKSVTDLLKIAAAVISRIWYILAHEKALPGDFAASKPERAFFSSPG